VSGRFWQGLRDSGLTGSGLGVGTVIRRPFLGRKPQVRSNDFRYYFPVRIGPAIRRGVHLPSVRTLHLIEALERLVQLYDATGQKAKADEWRKSLEEVKAAAKPPMR
jgi:hypothetical protein